ncbi:MAG: VanZ family protein [Candidatus Omnitrophica bacterium]|nr:VanZ family protein [Candidatus Omnitrophota bacterium]HOX55235.1 VanZ family protein [Candidatus Omnitrophota bacterium]
MGINKTNFFKLWIPVILYAGFIFYMSSLPAMTLPISFPHIDKIIHIAEYAVFGLLLVRAIKNSYSLLNNKKIYLIVLAIIFLYGASDELHQLFVSTRVCSGWDLLADVIGGMIGVYLLL